MEMLLFRGKVKYTHLQLILPTSVILYPGLYHLWSLAVLFLHLNCHIFLLVFQGILLPSISQRHNHRQSDGKETVIPCSDYSWALEQSYFHTSST